MLAVDLRGHVEPQPVGAVLLEVHPGVLVEEVLHLPLPPRGTAAPLGRLAALEVDAAFVGVAVELPEHVVVRDRRGCRRRRRSRRGRAVRGVDEVRQLYGEPYDDSGAKNEAGL